PSQPVKPNVRRATLPKIRSGLSASSRLHPSSRHTSVRDPSRTYAAQTGVRAPKSSKIRQDEDRHRPPTPPDRPQPAPSSQALLAGRRASREDQRGVASSNPKPPFRHRREAPSHAEPSNPPASH